MAKYYDTDISLTIGTTGFPELIFCHDGVKHIYYFEPIESPNNDQILEGLEHLVKAAKSSSAFLKQTKEMSESNE